VRDLVSEVGVDARLYCRGEQFLRFEAQIAWPADARLRDGFSRIQEGALVAGLRWGRSRAASTLNSMAAEAAEFLRASRERGDVFVSGKVERHAGSEGELGLVWTEADRSFILVSARF
jgi:hypothetical protein